MLHVLVKFASGETYDTISSALSPNLMTKVLKADRWKRADPPRHAASRRWRHSPSVSSKTMWRTGLKLSNLDLFILLVFMDKLVDSRCGTHRSLREEELKRKRDTNEWLRKKNSGYEEEAEHSLCWSECRATEPAVDLTHHQSMVLPVPFLHDAPKVLSRIDMFLRLFAQWLVKEHGH